MTPLRPRAYFSADLMSGCHGCASSWTSFGCVCGGGWAAGAGRAAAAISVAATTIGDRTRLMKRSEASRYALGAIAVLAAVLGTGAGAAGGARGDGSLGAGAWSWFGD